MPIGLGHVTRSSRLAQSFSVIRRAEAVNSNGFSLVTPTTITGLVGVIHPKSTGLVRDEDQQHMTKTITVHTMFRLRGPVPGFQPDIVVWAGDQYVVTMIDDFSSYGAGHMTADCSSIDLLDQPAS